MGTLLSCDRDRVGKAEVVWVKLNLAKDAKKKRKGFCRHVSHKGKAKALLPPQST